MDDKKPIRVLRIIARLNIGGPAIQAVSLSRGLAGDGFETMLVCGSVSPDEGDMAYLANEKGVHPRYLAGFGREISPFDDLKSFLELKKIIRQFNPHIIHTHTAKAGTLGRLAALNMKKLFRTRKRIRTVHTFHGHIFHDYFSPLKTFLFIQIERFLARFTDKIIVISSLQKEDICRRYRLTRPGNVRVIPLGFDLTGFTGRGDGGKRIRDRFVPHDSGEILLVGIIGRLARVKNHRMFLKAVRYLKDKGKDGFFRFLIIGDGELREDLKEYVARLNVLESVIFTGWQRDMPALYKALDIVALTSLNEGTPVTLIEAMAAAKPVVSTDVGGVRDLMGVVDEKDIEGYKLAEHGILIPSDSEEALAGALLFLKDRREAAEKMAERGRKFVLGRYTMERLSGDIKRLYRKLIYD